MWRTKLVNFVFWIAFSVLCVYAASDTDEDNLRTITKRDCYEKLTEGHRLNHKDVFRSLDVKTVEDCQIACTEEKLKCRALAFGLVQDESGDNTTASSNTTKAICELGETPIKETSDLKPIGTIMDKDFNLYIKTLDCTIAMDFDTKFGSNNPSNQNTHEPEGLEGKPTESTEASTQNSDGAQKVQTVVAISPGLKKQYLHPVHQILMGEAPHRYAQPLNGRPLLSYESYYKPSLLDGYSQGPYAFGRPHDTYGYGRPGDDVDGSKHQVRPGGFESYPQRPQTPFHYDERPHRPIEYEEPARPPLDYGSGSQRPTDYVMRPQRPPRPNDHGPLPQFDYGSRPHQPDHYQERPQIHGHYNPLAPKPSDDYGSASQKPTDYVEKPQGIEYEKPHRPNKIPQGPQKPLTGYGEKPQKPPASYENKPQQPSSGYKEKPLIYPSYGEKTEKPNYQGYIPGPQEPQGYNEKPYSIVSYPQGPVYNNRPPHRPDGYDRPQLISRPGFHDYDRPNSADRPLYHVPRDPPRYDILRPNHDYDVGFLRPQRPAYDSHTTGSHYLSYHDEYFDLPHYRPIPNRYGSYIPRPEYYEYYRPKPINEYMFNQEIDRYDPNPGRPADLNPRPPSKDPDNPNLVVTGNYGRPGESLDVYHKPTKKPSYPNQIQGPSDGNKPKVPHSKPIVTQSIGPHGETITSIIEEWKREKYPGNKPRDVSSCFRRALAGKRVGRSYVRRALNCERVEDCQRECADENRFACEGFNYRLDPSGRGKGECELLDIPMQFLDIGRDLFPGEDYDYYDRDRNADGPLCDKGNRYYPNRIEPGNHFSSNGDHRGDRWPDYGDRDERPPRPIDYDWRQPSAPPPYRGDDYRPNDNRRGDFAHNHHHSHHSHQQHYDQSYHGGHYLPPRPHYPSNYDYKSYEPFLPSDRRPPPKYDIYDRRDKDYWGYSQQSWGEYGNSNKYNGLDRKHYYLPPKPEENKDLGQYGGGYGNGYGYSHKKNGWTSNDLLPPYKTPSFGGGSYLPDPPRKAPSTSYLPTSPSTGGSYPPSSFNHGGGYIAPTSGGSFVPSLPDNSNSYLPSTVNNGGGYLPPIPSSGSGYPPKIPSSGVSYLPLPPKPDYSVDNYPNSILPAEPRHPLPPYNFIKDECSLRTATGFRLHKGIVKKFFEVPNIYECELLCFKERDFQCTSYAYRYTVPLTAPTDNCYLSNKNYKELDYYTDLQPDRDFDIYTMNNQNHCGQPTVKGQDSSECFWRVRSAQRFDHKVVRDTMNVKSIVECQIECLSASGFTCRAFSYRYGSPVIGGIIDNCQLTDWPYYELDPRIHFVPEQGFEVYERGSYGHGCEPYPFGTMGKPWKDHGEKADHLCYVGYGSPSRLLPQATKKSIRVATEFDCKTECTKLRDGTLFQCMSFSFRTTGNQWTDNCLLSNILQRDLLPLADYVPDNNWWLFAWDNYNPECTALANKPIHNPHDRNHGNHIIGGGWQDRIGYDPLNALGTWRVYSVSGWPCRRGTVCQENREAGFWFCELEGGDINTWDYCCRPDHQCGFSEGFSYQWCYVGPGRTQWRKCSDRYYPYVHHLIADRFDERPPQLGGSSHDWAPLFAQPPPHRPGVRPDRPPAPATQPPPYPSLDEYEAQFESQFLDPPKPGGFGQPRHWPLSYLHKEKPPNSTDSESRLMKAARERNSNPKFAAIQNLIDVIKSNDLKNIQYQITNESNKQDDILFVKIPLPTNFTKESKKLEKMTLRSGKGIDLEPVDVDEKENEGVTSSNTKRSQKSAPAVQSSQRIAPVYRKSYITRTNVTNHRKSLVERTI